MTVQIIHGINEDCLPLATDDMLKRCRWFIFFCKNRHLVLDTKC